jgi:hypothetical protein
MRATRLRGGRDQYCTGRTASSSRHKRRKQSRPAASFYSIRAFTLSTKSAVNYDECRNCEHRNPGPGATLVAEKKDDLGSAFQNLYRELEPAENAAGPS